jgi:hypothetical protein
MLTVYIAAVVLMVLAATGASLRRLAEVRIRRVWLLWAALADQIMIISVLPDSHPTLLAVAHVASYLAAGLCLIANRKVAGVWLLGVGGVLNGVVIALNGGTLPASAAALRAAGRSQGTGHFENSAALPNPKLSVLGDIFATPSWLPGHSVFSIGDLAIWLGIVVFLWRTCRSRAPHVGAHRPQTLAAAAASEAHLSGSGPR